MAGIPRDSAVICELKRLKRSVSFVLSLVSEVMKEDSHQIEFSRFQQRDCFVMEGKELRRRKTPYKSRLPFEYGISCPSEEIVNSFRSAMDPLQIFIHRNKTRKGIGSMGKSVVSVLFSWLHCEDHDIKEIVANELVRYVLLRYCREGTVDT